MPDTPTSLRQAAQAAYDFLQDKSFIPDSDTHRCTAIVEALDAALRHDAAPAAAPARQEAAAAIELAYGLLWHISTDNRTWNGLAMQTARQTLLAQLDRDGQARGIAAAKAQFLEFTADPRKNPRTSERWPPNPLKDGR